MAGKKKGIVQIWLDPDPNPIYDTRVYMLQMERWGYYKIGITENLDKRVRSIQNGNPIAIDIYYASGWLTKTDARIIEGDAHYTLRQRRSKAPYQREWFELSEWDARQTRDELTKKAEQRRVKTEQYEHERTRIDPDVYQVIDIIPENYTTARLYALQQGFLPSEINIGQVARIARSLCDRAGHEVLPVRLTAQLRKDGTRGEITGIAFPVDILDRALSEVIRSKYR